MKEYLSAPLPFVGQKRRFAKSFKTVLKGFSDKTIFVDLFGGSGILSHIAKYERPDATIVYNDFDNYRLRIKNVHRTNILLNDLRSMIKNIPYKARIIDSGIYNSILQRVKDEESRNGYVDYITLSPSLLFSMHYAKNFEELSKSTFYNVFKQSDYNCEGYLEGVNIVSCDYKILYEQYKDDPNVVFLVDPPYLSTDVGIYKMYWRLTDYLDVLSVLNKTSFVFFTSNKSSLIELCEWIGKQYLTEDPFKEAQKIEYKSAPSRNARYQDIMFYKRKTA